MKIRKGTEGYKLGRPFLERFYMSLSKEQKKIYFMPLTGREKSFEKIDPQKPYVGPTTDGGREKTLLFVIWVLLVILVSVGFCFVVKELTQDED